MHDLTPECDMVLAMLTKAEALRSSRQRRNLYFSANLFGEAAWDMLLTLYIDEARGRTTSVASACLNAAVAVSTGARWVAILEAQGLIQRSDADDAAFGTMTLTREGHSRMESYLGH
jgi:hypothetical protein